MLARNRNAAGKQPYGRILHIGRAGTERLQLFLHRALRQNNIVQIHVVVQKAKRIQLGIVYKVELLAADVRDVVFEYLHVIADLRLVR